MHTEISLSLTYTQKCASLRDIPHRLFSSFLPHIHRTLYWERWPTRTRCSAGCLTFCNKLYGKRTQKRLNMLHGYTIPESHDCILTTSTGWQTDCTPTYNQDEVKGKERKSMPVLLHTMGMKSKERRENQCQLYSFQAPSSVLQWHPRSLSRLESQGWTGVGSRQPGRVPFTEPLFSYYYYYFWVPFKITTVCLSWLGPDSWVGSKPGGLWRQ